MPVEDQTFPRRIWLPSILTAASIAAGFLSMIVAAAGRFDAAVYLLVLAIMLDTIDGRVARWLGATSEFGRELDSISDAVSSGSRRVKWLKLSDGLHEYPKAEPESGIEV